MVRAARATPFVDTFPRLLACALSVLLLLTAIAVATPTTAASVGDGVGALRARQIRTEATMLRADKQVKRLKAQRQHHEKRLKVAKRKLERTIERRDGVKARLERTTSRLEARETSLARAVRVRPNPKGSQAVDKPALRKQIRKLERKAAKLERKVRKHIRKAERARDIKQSRLKKVGKARILARKAARERAEDKLGVAISQMIELAQSRAGARLRPASVDDFKRPAKGTISQRYGCTGWYMNPRRGSCRHFHDGVDIAAQRGTRVRASADGYVAYVGRNPWDRGSRAFVVIIGHAGGYKSVYAHLQPRSRVKAGQRVEQGDVVGRIGMTGKSTGPHVHWEVSRGSTTLDPFRAGH